MGYRHIRKSPPPECGYLREGNSLAVGHGPAERGEVNGTISTAIVLADGRTELPVEVDYIATVGKSLGETIVEKGDIEIVAIRLIGKLRKRPWHDTLKGNPWHDDTESELIAECRRDAERLA